MSDDSKVDAWMPPRKTGVVGVTVDSTMWDRYRPETKTATVKIAELQ